MIIRSLAQRYGSWRRFAALSLAIAIPLSLSSMHTASARPMVSISQTKSTINELPSAERAALYRGEVLVEGENGEFRGKVLVNAPLDKAWEVLTDYDNFENFLPNIESSALLESDGNRNVFEQVNVIKVIPFVTTRSRIEIQSVETYPQRVEFSLVRGDLDALDGVWQLEPIATADGERVLVTHRVSVEPGNGSPRSIFFSTYKSILEGSLSAAKQETEERAMAAAAL